MDIDHKKKQMLSENTSENKTITFLSKNNMTEEISTF